LAPIKGAFVRNRQVPRAEWHGFFSDFNHRHQHELANVMLTSGNVGAQHIATGLPFEGFVADPLGARISIALGGTPEANIEHTIDTPTGVWVEHDDDEREIAIKIESENGEATILEFGQAARLGAERRSAAAV
jgi:hypothetical protein